MNVGAGRARRRSRLRPAHRLTDAELDAPPVRDEDRQPLWHYVMHLVSHGIQQFSEAAVLLSMAGHSPGDIGFLEFVGRRPRPG